MKDSLMQNKVEELLRQRIGLNPESIGSRSILRAVRKGMRTGKMNGISDYVKGLEDNPDLFEALVSSIVVPETSFFRNRASFVFLRQWVSQEWSKTKSAHQENENSSSQTAHQKLRILSIPCSTGEEPYSIAITLLEEGLSLDEFHIDAVDINEQAITKAKQGIYSPYAFKAPTQQGNSKYFSMKTPSTSASKRLEKSTKKSAEKLSVQNTEKRTETQTKKRTEKRSVQRYHLKESIREKVVFTQGNLLTPGLLAHQPPYDVIFCRNLLIYFDQTARDHAMTFLGKMLKPKGLLFLGHAEAGLVDTQKYKPVPYPQTFAYYRREHSVTSHAFATANSTSQVSPIQQQSSGELEKPVSQLPPTVTTATAASLSTEGAKPPTLASAQQLANSGNIEQAVMQCDAYLLHDPTDAKAHLLRGELYQAVDNLKAAENCFEKAVYLDSQLVTALMHLMLIKEEQGAKEEVALLRDRIQRIENLTV
ncbi:MAG: CheR family methyltransferase [Phormidesmis sp.]